MPSIVGLLLVRLFLFACCFLAAHSHDTTLRAVSLVCGRQSSIEVVLHLDQQRVVYWDRNVVQAVIVMVIVRCIAVEIVDYPANTVDMPISVRGR